MKYTNYFFATDIPMIPAETQETTAGGGVNGAEGAAGSVLAREHPNCFIPAAFAKLRHDDSAGIEIR